MGNRKRNKNRNRSKRNKKENKKWLMNRNVKLKKMKKKKNKVNKAMMSNRSKNRPNKFKALITNLLNSHISIMTKTLSNIITLISHNTNNHTIVITSPCILITTINKNNNQFNMLLMIKMVSQLINMFTNPIQMAIKCNIPINKANMRNSITKIRKKIKLEMRDKKNNKDKKNSKENRNSSNNKLNNLFNIQCPCTHNSHTHPIEQSLENLPMGK